MAKARTRQIKTMVKQAAADIERLQQKRALQRVLLTGMHCPNCSRPIKRGDWVIAGSTLMEVTHVVCSPPRPRAGLKRDRAKPLLEMGGSDDAEI